MHASHLTHQPLHYFNWRLYLAEKATGTFAQDWSPIQGYANPGACSCLHWQRFSGRKLKWSHAVAAIWRTQPWYPLSYLQISTSDSTATRCGDLTNSGGIHNAGRGTTISRLAIIRDQSRSGGLSEGASHLLEFSWRNKTKSTYESLFKLWNNWCQEQGRDPDPVEDILNFLAELFEQGYQYRSLNAYMQVCHFLSS